MAHPRAGGENSRRSLSTPPVPGSSPRGRGKLAQPHSICDLPGLIPARAGKTFRVPLGFASRAAHPRAGGENHDVCRANVLGRGSSPRGRGKQELPRLQAPQPGLIPARAGKTGTVVVSQSMRAAHPRAGGENGPLPADGMELDGSSPRGRGKHFLTCAFMKRIGQILETLELAVSSESYSLSAAYASDAPQDQARNTGLALPSSRAAS